MRLRNNKNKEEILSSSKYLIRDDLEKNMGKWKDAFKNNNPIHIEIGMGKGKFIIENALKFPNINFIGIEKYDNVLARALPKIPDDLDNLLIIRMDAINIAEVFNREIDRIYLNFSDPWPKDRHIKRRLTSPIFLEKYDHIFKDKKEIFLKTDNVGLFDYSKESLSEYGYTLSDVTYDLHSNSNDIITTEYEDKFREKGIPIAYLKATKND